MDKMYKKPRPGPGPIEGFSTKQVYPPGSPCGDPGAPVATPTGSAYASRRVPAGPGWVMVLSFGFVNFLP